MPCAEKKHFVDPLAGMTSEQHHQRELFEARMRANRLYGLPRIFGGDEYDRTLQIGKMFKHPPPKRTPRKRWRDRFTLDGVVCVGGLSLALICAALVMVLSSK